MKYLLVFLISGSALACKIDPRTAKRSEKSAAIALVKSKNKNRELKIRRKKGHYLVRSIKPTCIEYKVKIRRTPDCKMHPEILSEGPCP